ncbi:TetR/AcrR family transcriptional regulator [Sphingobium algorifonticola]|uniref:TetR/AcrR family transcriptional regulator n=1 Tax=Sphingobium algorifonticola TaxID=2008318 RepID=A0A437JBG7_9SPHN|nr:TetR/AcrR family transcriptional regulator [Sphingobium algorifonticola]RVT43214.1 TetR/AcrR family transcriptional regulator [Sphingobium algorifonticola]
MGREKLKDEDLIEARAMICQASLKLFAASGYDAVTMRAIAAELGWSAMTTYRYFPNKQSIFEAVREAALIRLSDAVADATRDCTNPVERLRSSFVAYAAFAIDNPNEYALAFEVYEQEMAAFPLSTTDTLRSWQISYDAAQEAYAAGLMTQDPNLAVHLLWAGVHGIIELSSARRLIFGIARDELITPMIDTLLSSFTVPSV